MTFRENLFAARSHIVFIAALLCASALVIWLDRQASAASVIDSDCAGVEATGSDIATALSNLVHPSPQA